MPTSGEKLYRMRRTLSVLSPGYASRRSAGFAGAVSAASGLMPGWPGGPPPPKKKKKKNQNKGKRGGGRGPPPPEK